MPLVWRNTTYWELAPDSPREQLATNNGRTQRMVKVRWADRVQAAIDFLGSNTRQGIVPNAAIVGGLNQAVGGNSNLLRKAPHRHPDYPRLYCQAVDCEGVGTRGVAANGVALYEWAKLTLTYSVLSFNLDYAEAGVVIDEGQAVADRAPKWVTEVFRPANRLLVLSKGLMKIVPDNTVTAQNTTIKEGLPVVTPGRLIQYTWHWVPENCLPRQTWLAAQGSINDTAFAGYPAGTLLLEDIEPTVEDHPLHGRIWTIRYGVKADLKRDPRTGNYLGWNYHLDTYKQNANGPTLLGMFLVSSDGTAAGTKKFQTYDFRRLFRPE